MKFGEILNHVLDDGIEEVRLAYPRPDQKMKRDGAMAGFEACRGKKPAEIVVLAREAEAATRAAHAAEAPDYWFWRCRQLQVEWVANVLSVVLTNEGQPAIGKVTARGVMKAAGIVGIRPG